MLIRRRGALISECAYKYRRNEPMMKTTLTVAAIAAALTAVSNVTPVRAQIDMKTGLHLDDPAGFRERRNDSSATFGVGGGVSVGRPQEYTPGSPLRPKRRAARK
jgi:hypothetical protein